MSGTNAKPSQGTLLNVFGVLPSGNASVSGSTAPAYYPIAEQINLKGPSISAKALKATNQTTSGNVQEYISDTLVDGGEVELTGNFLPDTHVVTIGMVGTQQAWQIVWNQVTPVVTAAFEGILTDFEPTSEEEKPLEFSLKIKVTGAVTWT